MKNLATSCSFNESIPLSNIVLCRILFDTVKDRGPIPVLYRYFNVFWLESLIEHLLTRIYICENAKFIYRIMTQKVFRRRFRTSSNAIPTTRKQCVLSLKCLRLLLSTISVTVILIFSIQRGIVYSKINLPSFLNMSDTVTVAGRRKGFGNFKHGSNNMSENGKKRTMPLVKFNLNGPTHKFSTELSHNRISDFERNEQFQSVSRYIRWHSAMMKCLRFDSCSIEIPIIIWRCPNGRSVKCYGLGDRFRGILSTFTLAMLLNRVFLLDWPEGSVDFLHLLSPSSIDWRMPKHINISQLPTLKDNSKAQYSWNNYQTEGISGFRLANNSLISCNDKERFPEFLMLSESAVHVLRCFPAVVVTTFTTSSKYILRQKEWTAGFEDFNSQKLSSLLLHRFLFRKLIKPGKMVKENIQAIQYNEDQGQRDYISFHIRTGEDIGEGHLNRFADQPYSQVQILSQAMTCVTNSIKPVQKWIFIASDSSRLKTALIEALKEEGFKVMYSNITAFHVARNYSEPINHLQRERNRTTDALGLLGVFVDFFALAGGTSFITTISEFSTMAFIYSDAGTMNTVQSKNRNSSECPRYLSFG